MTERITIAFNRMPAAGAELDAITPDRIAALSASEIAQLPIWIAGQSIPLGELATVTRGGGGSGGGGEGEGDERSASVRLEGDLRLAGGIGAGMRAGVLEVAGSVGDGAGVGMSGGVLRIRGDAGARLGSALPGASKGMTGGDIVVDGRAGPDAGAYARRGLIVVRGEVGANAAHGMIAGTLVAFGRLGADVGTWSKRGSVVALDGLTVPVTYRLACAYRPTVLRVLFAYLARAHGIMVEDRFVTGRWRRYCGDLSDVGRGELLIWAEA